jgi:hypothetical protein
VPTVRVGNADVNTSALRDLRVAFRRGELVLFLGAGVSIPYGVPSWRDLVLELLFEQSADTRRLGALWPHYRRAVASWMADYSDGDPLVLARMVERALGKSKKGGPSFVERLRRHLYAQAHRPAGRTLLRAVVDLAARKPAGLAGVVTFNFDDLLEAELVRKRVAFSPVVGPERQQGRGLRVVHVHGFVPREGPIERRTMVFTEPDYHRLTESIFHWGLSEIVEALRKKTVLFLGLSMSDPSLRRLLDASRNALIPPHYQVQRRHQVRDAALAAAMAEVERRARIEGERMGRSDDAVKGPPALEKAVRSALRQADSYDRQVFESMGVKTIWVDSFDAIPAIVDAIALSPRPASRSRSASRRGRGARRDR